MVAALREWITSIILVTLLLSVTQALIPEGSIRKIASFTGGLILLLALTRPVLRVDLRELRLDLTPYERAVQERRAELETAEKQELEGIIARETAAYISDKAADLGLEVTAEVAVEWRADGIPVPAEAEITGPLSPELEDYLERELGISRERQVWNHE